MTKVDVVRAEMVKAMKAGDKERKNALSMLLSALKNATIDKRSDLTEEEADVIVRKEIKQTQETLDTTPAERTEIIEECKFRIAVYEEFVPKMMEADAIEAVIKETLAELGIDAPTVKDKGKIMKVVIRYVCIDISRVHMRALLENPRVSSSYSGFSAIRGFCCLLCTTQDEAAR